MASYEDYLSALPRVTYRGRSSGIQRDAVAHLLGGTRVPPEHIASLSAIHAGVDLPAGTHAQYNHNAGSLLLSSDPHSVSGLSAGMVASHTRLIAHETGHRFSHIANPVQFSQYIHNPVGRGILEASAENYADDAMPGTHAGYDPVVQQGKQPFDADSYKEIRGRRFGKIAGQ
jgi:hypothetical protein